MYGQPLSKVNVSIDTKAKSKKDLGSVVIEIVTDYDPYNPLHCVQEGVVTDVPRDGSAEVQIGDVVYIHHSSGEKGHPVLKGIYQVDNVMIYAYKRDGVLHTVKGWTFVEPMKETIDDIKQNGVFIKAIEGDKQGYGTAWLVDDELSQQGVVSGDLVSFVPNRGYGMYIDGKFYFRIRNRDVIALCYV
jgi:hypothetical protein